MKKNKQGFTLIELLLVVALLAVAVGVTSDILISLIRSQNKTQVTNEIEQQANFVALKLEKHLRRALSVSGGGNSIAISFPNNSSTTYSISNNVLYQDGVPMTSNAMPGGVRVNCVGACFDISGTSPQVVNLNLEFVQASASAGVSYTGSVKIQESIVIRNTY